MSNQLFGFYFSSDADRSTHDRTIYLDRNHEGNIILGAKYKNSERNTLYEAELDADDLESFGKMCIDLAKRMNTE